MLEAIGVSSVEDLFKDIPESVRLKGPLNLPGPFPEWELVRRMEDLAGRNRPATRLLSFLGAGCYNHHVPAALLHLIQRSEFYTAYTPYQPEVSQGTLQAIFEFQTYVARLTGMEVANASLYDGASSLAEAVLMAQRIRKGRSRVILPTTVHPEYRQVVRTLVGPLRLEILEPPETATLEADWEVLKDLLDSKVSCVVIQNPNFFGTIEDLDGIRDLAQRAREVEALFIVLIVEPLSLGILLPPGEYGADVVAAEGQSFGIPMSFGGPHLGLFATRSAFVRQMPGRLVGQTRDARGNLGYVLTLATREQHIRRERATSNICTNQSLCALAAAVYLSMAGRTGLQRLAALNVNRTRQAMDALDGIEGFHIVQRRCFNEFVARPPVPPSLLNQRLMERGILGGLDLSRFDSRWEGLWLLCCTEKTSLEDIQTLRKSIEEIVDV
jgi:glycine dehydrogenase subunit 1